jgi:quinol monooxygenase YgiN
VARQLHRRQVDYSEVRVSHRKRERAGVQALSGQDRVSLLVIGGKAICDFEADRRAPRVPSHREEHVMVKVGLLVRFDALPGKEDEVASFLEGALPLVNEEVSTLVWHAIRLGPSTFGIFDAFPDEAGRQAHLNGKVAEALLGSVGDLVSQPTIEEVDVLASKTPG